MEVGLDTFDTEVHRPDLLGVTGVTPDRAGVRSRHFGRRLVESDLVGVSSLTAGAGALTLGCSRPDVS